MTETKLTKHEQTEPKIWRCFHCDEVFYTYAAARHHFGREQGAEPVCLIKAPGEWALVDALRKAEDLLARYRAEDSDVLRAMASMSADHQTALRREEEKGYERAIRDLSSAIQKLAPDLAEDIATRWTKAKDEGNAALEEILAVLRRPEDAIRDAR